MLIYESEGFLEVESKSIKQLCRSTASVSLGDTKREAAAVSAALCDYLDNSEQRCRVAFYSKVLKRAFIFAVKGSERQTPWQSGQKVLAQLGFQLEDVNLKLSPAMLEVVLRDVPGLLSPVDARKQRTEKSTLLAELQSAYDKDPKSAQGKKAALKLGAEERMNAQSEELRNHLQELFSSHESANVEFEALVSQVKDLTSRLEAAVALAEAERNQREMSEAIVAAAEKRIQELEEVLVDVETTSSKSLKQSQKMIQFQGRIKELCSALESAEAEVEKERAKQQQFVADVNMAHERIAPLENELKEMATSLENVQAQLVTEQAEKAQLDEDLHEAELRINALDSGLKNAEKKAAQSEDSAQLAESIQNQLVEVQQALKDSLELNRGLEEKLAKAHGENEGLRESLHVAENVASDKKKDDAQGILTEQNEDLNRELKALRDEYDQECSIRRRLEKGAFEEDKRIQELEASLAKMSQNALETPTVLKSSARDQDLATLRAEVKDLSKQLETERQTREEIESEADEAHRLIDSLEKMIRETEGSSTEKRSHAMSKKSESQSDKVLELEEKLKTVELQLEQELVEQKRLAKAVAAAEKKCSEQEEILVQKQAAQFERNARQAVVVETVVPGQSKPSKPLPHELRPAPKKGAFFRPDWNLEGLPCQSSGQVFKAWETVFNVQTSLEGYPSQYCMAFLVVLRLEKQKKLYMLFRLKQNKHTLVCVPAKAPHDEASLKSSIREGLNFLKVSGFEMDEMTDENIDSTLSRYFLEG